MNMFINNGDYKISRQYNRILSIATLSFSFTVLALFFSSVEFANADGICSKTAKITYSACQNDLRDDYLIAKANCLNLKNEETRKSCLHDARTEHKENKVLCKAQRHARFDVCDKIGEQRYDITEFWIPDNFVDPTQIGISVSPNMYFPLVPGTNVYIAGEENITVTVTNKTKLINGVNCLVVKDVVQIDGRDLEVTDDWYAQDVNGNVWYCGEISKNIEFFTGDSPEMAELVDLEGSWKGFRDGAMPGIQMKANPQVGDTYRQEISLAEAEDMANIIAIDADGMLAGDFCEENNTEIANYIESICNNDCLVTLEYTPIEPDAKEHKYFAPGLGFILETNPEGGCVIPEGAI